jgi:hypothetical protein
MKTSISRTSAFARFARPVLAAVLIIGCADRDNDAPDTGPDESTPPRIAGEAKVALDSGNVLFRAKAYDLALVQYRRSSQLAPGDPTPLFGVLMVGEATGNSRLADSARARIRELDPSLSDSTAKGHAEMIDRHSRMTTTPPSPH